MNEVAGEDDGDEDGVGEFEAGAGEEAEEGTPCGTEGVAALLAAEEFAREGAYEWPKDDAEDACGAEGQPDNADDETYVAAPDTGFAASVAFGAEGGDDVVEHGDDGCNGGCGDKEEGCVVGSIGEAHQQQCQPAEGRTCEAGDDGAGDAYQGADDGEDDECGVHFEYRLVSS